MPRKRISITQSAKSFNYQSIYDEYVKEKSCTASTATIKGYKYRLLPFINYLLDNDLEVNQSTINDYILILNDKYDNKVTFNSTLRDIRAFCNWLTTNDYAPKLKITVKKEYEVTKEVYTEEEIKKLLIKPSTNNFTDYRNWCMINFFIGTGCRINTLINVKISDIDFNNDYIIFKVTKNKKQQVIPLCTALKKAINAYLKLWVHKDSDYLFPNSYGEKLNNNSVTHAINHYNKERGVTKTSCHLFRHTFAHNYLMNGGDIFRLQQILGHQTLDMVKIYANMNNIDSLKNDFNKLNMLDNININKNKIKINKIM